MKQNRGAESISEGFSAFRRARGKMIDDISTEVLTTYDGIPGINVLDPQGEQEPRVRLMASEQIVNSPLAIRNLSRLAVYSEVTEQEVFNETLRATAVATTYKDNKKAGTGGRVYIEFDEKTVKRLNMERAVFTNVMANLAEVPISTTRIASLTPNLSIASLSHEMCGVNDDMRELLEENMPFEVVLRRLKLLPRI